MNPQPRPHPTRPLRTILGLSLLLSACAAPPAPPTIGTALQPGQTTLNLTRSGLTVRLPVGTWKLSGVPEWLTATPQAAVQGEGGRWTISGDPVAVLNDAPTRSEGRAVLRFSGPGGDRLLTVVWPLSKVTGNVRGGGLGTAQLGAGPHVTRSAPQAVNSSGPGRVIVEYRADEAGPPLTAAMYKTLRIGAGEGGVLTQVIEVDDVGQAITRLRGDPMVSRVFADGKMRVAQALDPVAPAFTPGDEFGAKQWQLRKLGYAAVLADHPEAYPNAVTVAVVDTGIRAQHPDLSGRIWTTGGLDLSGTTPDADPTDTAESGSHGTAVAGLIVANQNKIGVAGGTLNAPVKALAVRVIGAGADEGDISTVMLGVRYAAGEKVSVGGTEYVNPHPAQIINLSLGVAGNDINQDQKDFICAAVTAATGRGALVVAAAGNTGRPDVFYPAACPGAVAVGALTLSATGQWKAAPYSATGPQVALSAPGGDLTTSYNAAVGGQAERDGLLTTDWVSGQPVYRYEEGTSFAAPTVSAVAALMLAKGVTSTSAQTAARLTASVTDVGAVGRDDATGAGVIDPGRALGLTGTPPGPGTPVVKQGMAEFTPAGSARVLRVLADDQGNWTAYLSGGAYRVRSGIDANGDGALNADETANDSTLTVEDLRKP